MTYDLRIAVVCSSNQNRSMEGHAVLRSYTLTIIIDHKLKSIDFSL